MNLKDEQILKQLAKYKYLTTGSHMVELLGIATHRNNLNAILNSLRRKALIDRVEFGAHPKYGRLENMYFLTSKGTKYLMDEYFYTSDEVKSVRSKQDVFHQDYHHRFGTISINIRLNQYFEKSGYKIFLNNYYFDSKGGNGDRASEKLQSLNRIPISENQGLYIIPDITIIAENENKESAYLVEFHRGKDTKRAIRQLEYHKKAMINGDSSTALNYYNKTPRLLMIFENSEYKENLLDRVNLESDFKGFEDLFLFKTYDEVMFQNINTNWDTIDRRRISLVS